MTKNCYYVILISLFTLFSSGCAYDPTNYRVKSDGVYWYKPASLITKERYEKIINADKKTFKSVDGKIDIYGKYGTDKNHVYYEGNPIPFADPKTFKLLNQRYIQDKNYVYYMGRKVLGVSSSDFKITEQSGDYGITSDKAVSYGKSFNPCDITTFKPHEENYIFWSLDDKCVYFNEKTFTNIDRDSFKWLNLRFTKDKNYVYYKDNILIDADPKTFFLTKEKGSKSSVYAKDAKNCWNKDAQIIDCNSQKKKINQKSLLQMSDQEIIEASTKAAFNMYRKDYLEKEEKLSKHKQTIASILKQHKNKILTPNDVKNINLAEIKENFTITLQSTVNMSFSYPKRITYILKNKEGNNFYFDVFQSETKSVLTEIRNKNGEIKKKANTSTLFPSEIDYKKRDCRFVIGKCTEDYHPYYIKDGQYGEKYSRDFITQYKDGVWIRSIKTEDNIKNKTIYDKNGFPIYRLILIAGDYIDEFIVVE